MSRPLTATGEAKRLGPVDEEAGEFWYGNPFLIAANGSNLSAFERNRTFVGAPGAPFLDVTYATPASLDSDSRSAVVADFDGDGAPDLLVGSAGGGPLRLFLNAIRDNGRRVRIELSGTRSNRAGIGARIEIRAGELRAVRDVFPPNGFMGQGPPDLLLGVGGAERIDELVIRWPSGHVQAFVDVPTDVTLRIAEDAAEPDVLPLARE